MFPACLFSVKPLHSCKHFHWWSQGASKGRQVGCPPISLWIYSLIFIYSFIFCLKAAATDPSGLALKCLRLNEGSRGMTRGSGRVDVSVTVPWIFTLTTHSPPLADPLCVSVSLPGRLLWNTIQTKRCKAPKKSNKKSGAGESSSAPLIPLASPPLLRTCWLFWNRPDGRHLFAKLVRFTPFVIPSCSSCTRPLRLPLRWSW